MINDDTAFCNSEVTRIGRANVCANYQTGRCCRFCNSNAVVIPRLHAHEVRDWITPKTLNNQRLLSSATAANNDASFCSNNIHIWRKSMPDICTNTRYVMGTGPICDQCKNICATLSIV